MSNTPRQVLLYRAMGVTPPTFAHLSLVLGPDHTPLSKRHGATSVAEFRAKGILPESLVNYLALIGWSPGQDQELLPADELARRFKLEAVGKSAGVFDLEKLAWVNRHYVKEAASERLAELAVPFLRQAGVLDWRRVDGLAGSARVSHVGDADGEGRGGYAGGHPRAAARAVRVRRVVGGRVARSRDGAGERGGRRRSGRGAARRACRGAAYRRPRRLPRHRRSREERRAGRRARRCSIRSAWR